MKVISTYEFTERLAFSRGNCEITDIEILKNEILGCVSVEKTDEETDKTGIDYIATLRGGYKVKIDAKTRTEGCSEFWRNGPELALEIWSVIKDKRNAAKTGWTLDEKKDVDLILFTFDKKDSLNFYILPFQQLRIAFRRNFKKWDLKYKKDRQKSIDKNSGNQWRSECIFIPVDIVLQAINSEMVHKFESTAKPIHENVITESKKEDLIITKSTQLSLF